MSKTYSIGCKDCKQKLWIAQGSYDTPKTGHVYNADAASHRLYHFFIEHIKHNLIFDEDCESETFEDFEEIDQEYYK